MKGQQDIIQVEGVNSKGFGIIPKMVMQDKRLSVQAKAIYAYFCSFAGAGSQAFPRVIKIIKDLGISKNSYYKHFNQLRVWGYIKAEQEHRDGRLSHNIYTLVTEIQCTKIQDTVIQDTVFCDANINNSNKNKHIFIKNTLSLSPPQGDEAKSSEYLADEVAEEETETPVDHSTELTDGFETFWNTYPRKESKVAAERAWYKINPSGELIATMLVAVEAAKRSDQWRRDNGRYIPAPAKWIREQRWMDKPSNTHTGEPGASYDLQAIQALIDSEDYYASMLEGREDL